MDPLPLCEDLANCIDDFLHILQAATCIAVDVLQTKSFAFREDLARFFAAGALTLSSGFIARNCARLIGHL
jgi:hypothetical protein